MALSFVIRKAVSLSPKLVVPIALPASSGSLSVPNALRSMSTLGGRISEAIEVTPLQQAEDHFGRQQDQPMPAPAQQQDHPDHPRVSDDPPATKRSSLRRAASDDPKRASNKKLLSDLKPKKVHLISANLGGFSIQEIPRSEKLVLMRQDFDERIEVEVNMSDFEYEEDEFHKPISMTVNVMRENATNQFKISLSSKEILINSMTLVSATTDEEKESAVVNYKDLDDLWQQRLHEYLEARGIKPDIAMLLKDYTKDKKRTENIWLWKSRFVDFFLKPEKSSDE